MSTPHNKASESDVAKTVLLPGDPLRAEYIANNFLENAKKITDVRNMFGFTGTYNGKPITVMGSGMGGPSCGIYSYELFKFYNVDRIIRIGTAGGLQPHLIPGDLVFATTASTDSAWANQYKLPGTFSPSVDYPMLQAAVESATKRNISHYVGGVFSSDCFSDYSALYEVTNAPSWKPWARMGVLAHDMETYALYSTAAWTGKRALSILTHTDSCVDPKLFLSDEQRMPALEKMFLVALDVATQEN